MMGGREGGSEGGWEGGRLIKYSGSVGHIGLCKTRRYENDSK